MTALPHFSLGKYSRCLFPSFGNPWGLFADKLLHTSKKAGREKMGQSSDSQPGVLLPSRAQLVMSGGIFDLYLERCYWHLLGGAQ